MKPWVVLSLHNLFNIWFYGIAFKGEGDLTRFVWLACKLIFLYVVLEKDKLKYPLPLNKITLVNNKKGAWVFSTNYDPWGVPDD